MIKYWNKILQIKTVKAL